MTNSDIVQKLWNLCDVLRDDGINYSDYVTELVLLLFIKMEYEQVQNNDNFAHKLPRGHAGPIWLANPVLTYSTTTDRCCWIWARTATR